MGCALLELAEATEEAPVPYSGDLPDAEEEVETRGWGSEPAQPLQLASMEVSNLNWDRAEAGNRMLLKDVAEGVAENGDSGAGVYHRRSVYRVVSTADLGARGFPPRSQRAMSCAGSSG